MMPAVECSHATGVGWLIRSVVAIAALLCLVPEAGLLAGDGSSTELRISVTIPPTPCQYPKPCAPPVADAATRLVVSGSVIRYVGSPPLIVRSNGMLSILF